MNLRMTVQKTPKVSDEFRHGGPAVAIGRNPDAEGPVRTAMILGLGFAEAVAIYSLVVALVIIFVG